VLAGKYAEPIALNDHMYICQNDRSFQPSRYIAFVHEGVIRYLFEIVAGPYTECTAENTPILKTLQGYENAVYQIMYLKKVADIGPIQNDTRDKNGKLIAFTYGSNRYTTYESIMKAHKTSELR
jgi:hypothetical protein